MNSKTAKQISLISILDHLGVKKTKETNMDVWYLSPFRIENTASFKVNKHKNIYYDHGEGKGGNVLDFIMRYYICDFKSSLDIIKSSYFSFHQQPIIHTTPDERKKQYNIKLIQSITNQKLKNYIVNTRKLSLNIAKEYCREIHYQLDNGKSYYGISFKNDHGGYVVRNPFIKLCLGKQGITSFYNDSEILIVFEGWADYIAFLTLNPQLENKNDYIILNSTNAINQLLKNKLEKLRKYHTILLYLDNDDAGDLATKSMQKALPTIARDERVYLKEFKDVNDLLINKKLQII